MIKTIACRLILLLAVMALGACSSTPDPILYFMDSKYDTSKAPDNQNPIGLAEVTLPEYARKDKISSTIGRNQISQSEKHQWAEAPEDAMANALARALESALSRSVLPRPYPRGIEPQQQVFVAFDRFLRGETGDAQLAGKFIVVSSKRDTPPILRSFAFTIKAVSSNYEDFVSAVMYGLKRLSDDISASIVAN